MYYNIRRSFALISIILSAIIISTECNKKYSKEANNLKKSPEIIKTEEDDLGRPISIKHLDRPFRMAKLNLLWSKAIYKLTDSKLISLFGELKLHDKEEITWKHLRAEGKDKDGLKEAELRTKLKTIMINYNLIDQLDNVNDEKQIYPHRALNEASDKHINKSLFKDKKLNKLWEKALMAGFNKDELSALNEEFHHHQDKIDQYYQLLHNVKSNTKDDHVEATIKNSIDDSLDKFNEIEILQNDNNKELNQDHYLDQINTIRDHHQQIKDNFDHLDKLASKGPASREFVEPKVQGLWRIALENNFTNAELQSLKSELMHYENRLLKLRHLQVEHALNEEKFNKKQKLTGEKSHGNKMLEDNIRKHARKVDKLHLDIETKIMQRHIEL